MKIFALIFATLLSVSLVYAAGSCKLGASNGKVIDLSGLDKRDGYYKTECSGWDCYVNVCEKAKSPDSACSEHTSAHGYQILGLHCHPLGNTDTAKITLIDTSNEKSGVKVVYGGVAGSDNIKRGIEFLIACDENVETFRPVFDGESNGATIVYRFTGSSKHACPVTGGGGGGDSNDLPLGHYGVGGLLLTLALVALMLYFIVGAILMKLKFQKTGLEIIPNIGFWKDIPFLLKDGAMLPVDLVRGQGKVYQTMA
ncbi:hypothetical protein ABK040_015144 [Willaertia magna]